LKIEKIEKFLIRNNIFVIRITTDTGISGVGQAAAYCFPEAVSTVTEKYEKFLIGKNPEDTEHIQQYLYRGFPFRGAIISSALSAIDIALWDIKGKIYDTPIWNLLGGKVRNKIRLHGLLGGQIDNSISRDENIRKNAAEWRDEGFTALKIDPLPSNYYDLTMDRLISATRDTVAAFREGAGPDVDIILEIHRKLTPMVNIPLAEALQEFNPMFYEDPIQIDSMMSQGELAKRISIPLANGENIHSIWEFRELLTHGGPQYIRPDVGLAGGITQVKKIASIGESFHSALVTHNFLGPILTAASVHIDATIPNFITQEYHKVDESEQNKVFKNSLKRKGGYILLPDQPGLGVEIDDGLLSENPHELLDIEDFPPLREDGSVAWSV
jgi:galactonate dehydratase